MDLSVFVVLTKVQLETCRRTLTNRLVQAFVLTSLSVYIRLLCKFECVLSPQHWQTTTPYTISPCFIVLEKLLEIYKKQEFSLICIYQISSAILYIVFKNVINQFVLEYKPSGYKRMSCLRVRTQWIISAPGKQEKWKQLVVFVHFNRLFHALQRLV